MPGYAGYYNHFNIGAYTANGNSAETNGAIYAKNVSSSYYGPWTDPIRSIKGGAKILTSAMCPADRIPCTSRSSTW